MDVAHKTLRSAAAITAVCLLLVGAGASPRARASALPQSQASRPSRIISVVPAVTEMLYAIGAGSQVVGVSSYDHFPAEVEQLPKVGALLDPDFEKILSLRPDLVIVYATQSDFIARLEKAGVPIFRYEHAGLPDITATIRRLATRVGHDADGARVAGRIESDLDAVRQRVAPFPRVRTLLIFGREAGGLRGIYASGGVGFLHDLLVVAGGIDVFDDLKRQSVQISSEQVLARAPDAIVELYDHGASREKLDLEKKVWLQLPSVPAVRNGKVYLLAADFLTSPGPRIADAARMFADALHPESIRRSPVK